MSPLPKWISKDTPWDTSDSSSQEIFKLRKALEIAWEALEFIENMDGYKSVSPYMAARQALGHIEELGAK